MTRVFRYSRRSIIAGYARSAVGLLVTLGALGLLQPSPWVGAGLAAGAAFFLLYAAKSFACHVSRIFLDDTGIRTQGPFVAAIGWDELQSVRLNFYATRRDHTDGWMELAIRSARTSIRIESTLEEFKGIAAAAAREAVRRRHLLDERTLFNLAAIGVVLDPRPEVANDSVPGSRSLPT